MVALGQTYYGKQSYVQGDHLLVDKTFHYITGKGSPAHRPIYVDINCNNLTIRVVSLNWRVRF